MIVEYIFNASGAIEQWKSTKHHIAPWNEQQVYEIVQTSHFQDWLKNNPSGTIDQYYSYLQKVQAYYNSPQYRIEELENEVQELNSNIENLQQSNIELKSEIKDKDNIIDNLNLTCQVTSFLILLLIGLSAYLYYKFKKTK